MKAQTILTSWNHVNPLLVYCVRQTRGFAHLTQPTEIVSPRAGSTLHPGIISTSRLASHLANQ